MKTLTVEQWQRILDLHKCRDCIYTDDCSDGNGLLIDSGAPLHERERVDLCGTCSGNVIVAVWRYFQGES